MLYRIMDEIFNAYKYFVSHFSLLEIRSLDRTSVEIVLFTAFIFVINIVDLIILHCADNALINVHTFLNYCESIVVSFEELMLACICEKVSSPSPSLCIQFKIGYV